MRGPEIRYVTEIWKRILWTDETKINRIGSDWKVYIWKERGESLYDRTTSPTVKHGGGGNLMVWGCMGWNGVGKLMEVQGNMDKVQYCEVLEDGVQESFEKLEMVVVSGTFSMIMTPNTCLDWPQNCLRTTTFP